MVVNQITVYACKNKRNNSKCDIFSIKSIKRNADETEGNFTEEGIEKLINFIDNAKYNDCYRLVVYTDNMNLRNWNTGYFVDKESLFKAVNIFKNLLNK